MSNHVVYDYGNTVVYEGDTVYYGGEEVASADEYYEEASAIAESGQTKVSDEAEWRPLGVFAMVQGDETEANKILQLAVNQQRVLRGNYLDVLNQTTLPITGSVDEESKRAAWTVGGNVEIAYETGIANLDEDETHILVHYGKDRTQQWLLVRLEEPEEQKAGARSHGGLWTQGLVGAGEVAAGAASDKPVGSRGGGNSSLRKVVEPAWAE